MTRLNPLVRKEGRAWVVIHADKPWPEYGRFSTRGEAEVIARALDLTSSLEKLMEANRKLDEAKAKNEQRPDPWARLPWSRRRL